MPMLHSLLTMSLTRQWESEIASRVVVAFCYPSLGCLPHLNWGKIAVFFPRGKYDSI